MAQLKPQKRGPGRGRKGQSLESMERAKEAAELKIAGWTWQKIADELGWKNRSSPMNAVKQYYAETREQQWEEYFPILNERGEMLWRQAQVKILEGQRDNDDVKWERGMRQGLSALQYLARITGVDAGLAVNVNTAASADVEQLRQEFMEIERGFRKGNVIDG